MNNEMTAEQAILVELLRVLSADGEVYRNVELMLRQALSAPRVPDKKPMPDLMMATWHENKGWNDCVDYMLTASPDPASPDQQVIADLRKKYDALLAKHQEVLDTVQACACAYDNPQDVCIGHAKIIADLRAEVEALRGSIPEWLCETCNTIHTPPEGLDLRCKTPGCDGVLKPSTYNERKLLERVKELESYFHKMIGVPASVGVCEPIEGYVERPGDTVAAMREMAARLREGGE